MALQIWLPLNGDLKNKGVADVTITNNGATVDSNGKIGNCYSFDGSNDYISLESQALYSIFKGGSQPFSIAFWVYHNDNSRAVLFGDYQLTGAINFNIELTTSHTFRFYWASSPDKTFTGSSVGVNTWTHVCVTYDGSKIVIYINGTALSDVYSGTLASKNKTTGVYYLGRDSRTGTTAFNGKLNDFRVYDHCLSVAEVKEISRGLVLHYKLNDSNILPSGLVLYDYIQSTGTQWIDTGVKGYMNHTYEIDFQQTDTGNYRIWGVLGQSSYVGYNMSLTYGNGWIARWNNTSNGQALVTLGTINTNRHVFKVVNGQCYFDNISKGTSSGHSSSFSIDNNLFLFTINPANTTPSSNSKCKIYKYKDLDENGNMIRYMVPCSYNNVVGMWDMVENQFYGNAGTGTFTLGTQLASNTTVIDSSGYGNNGTITNELIASSDTIRYGNSTLFDGTSYIYRTPINGSSEVKTISFWANWPSMNFSSNYASQCVLFVDNGTKTGFGLMSTGILLTTSAAGNSKTYSRSNLVANTWYHFVIIITGTTTRDLYINGVKQTPTTNSSNWTYSVNQLQIGKRSTTSDGFAGKISDFRMYVTELSEEDVLQLYQVSGKIDNKKNLHCFELKEHNTSDNTKLFKTGIFRAKEFNEIDNNIKIKEDLEVDSNQLIEM